MYWCIYQITNKINGKRYVGQHKYYDESNPMRGYRGSGKLLKKAYDKYGLNNFTTEVLYKRILNRSTADSMEIYTINKYKPEYNITKGGTGGNNRKSGWHHSEETRMKLSESNKGRHHTEETRRKMSKLKKGHIVSDETRRKQSASNRGQKRSAETCRNISNASKNRSIEWRRRLSDAHKGKNLSEETRRKISDSSKGRVAWNTGKKLTDEHKESVSQSLIGLHWWNNGIINKKSRECPGEDWKQGRLTPWQSGH